MTTTTTQSTSPVLTPQGVDFGEQYSTVKRQYDDHGHDVAYEDDEVVIYVDEARYEYSKIAKETGRTWEAVNGICADVARDKIDDAHLVFAAVDPVVLAKPEM